MTENTTEMRFIPATFEFRQAAEGREGLGTVVGIGVPYEKLSVDLGGWRERFRLGAFREHLETNPDVAGLMNHDYHWLLGRTKSGTMRLADTPDGVRVEIDMPDTQYARDAVASIKRGDLAGISVRFIAIEDEWRNTPEGQIREVIKAEQREYSLTGFPAYPDTTAALRRRPPVPEPARGPKAEDEDRRRRALAATYLRC